MSTQRRPREKRTRKRIPVRFGETANNLSGVGFTTNLSFKGMCISARLVYPVGALLRIDLQLPEGKICRASGRVAWCKPPLAQLAQAGSMGIQLESADALLGRYLEFLGSDDGGAGEEDAAAPATPLPPVRIEARPASDRPAPTVGLPTGASSTAARSTGARSIAARSIAARSMGARSIAGTRPRSPPVVGPGSSLPSSSSEPAIASPAGEARNELANLLDEELEDPLLMGLLLPLDEEDGPPSIVGPGRLSAGGASEIRPGGQPARPGRLIAITSVALSGKDELLQALSKRLPGQIVIVAEEHDAPPARILEVERAALAEGRGIALCSYTTIDAGDRAEGDKASFWAELGSTREEQLGRYHAVIHLRPPGPGGGGTRETVLAARALEELWSGHHRKHVVEWNPDLQRRLVVLEGYVGRYLPGPRDDQPAPSPRVDHSGGGIPGRPSRGMDGSSPLIQLDRAPRLHARWVVRYGKSRPLGLAGTSVNFSRSGLALACETPLARGETVMFTIQGPGGETCRGSGTVVWARLRPGGPGALMGIRLLRVHESYLRLLETLSAAS